MVILENIDIDKAILQNIDIDKISNRFKFGISNRARATPNSLGTSKELILYHHDDDIYDDDDDLDFINVKMAAPNYLGTSKARRTCPTRRTHVLILVNSASR